MTDFTRRAAPAFASSTPEIAPPFSDDHAPRNEGKRFYLWREAHLEYEQACDEGRPASEKDALLEKEAFWFEVMCERAPRSWLEMELLARGALHGAAMHHRKRSAPRDPLLWNSDHFEWSAQAYERGVIGALWSFHRAAYHMRTGPLLIRGCGG